MSLALSRYGSIEVFDTGLDSESSEDYKASGVQRYSKHHDQSKTPDFLQQSHFRTSTFLYLSFTLLKQMTLEIVCQDLQEIAW